MTDEISLAILTLIYNNLILPEGVKMSKQISRVVERYITFLKLTRAGKLYLSAFPDKVIYRAKDMYTRQDHPKPDHPFAVFAAMCFYKQGARDIEECIDTEYWDYIDESYKGSDMTHDGEKRRDDIISAELIAIRKEMRAKFNAKNPVKKSQYNYSSNNSKTSGPGFNRGIMYFKYGQWFKYPDAAWSRDSRPSLPVSSSQAKWLIDRGINPKDVLRKALDDNILAEEQVSIFELYESPMMKEFLKEQGGEQPRTNPVPPGTKPRTVLDDEQRFDINPLEELKKLEIQGTM